MSANCSPTRRRMTAIVNDTTGLRAKTRTRIAELMCEAHDIETKLASAAVSAEEEGPLREHHKRLTERVEVFQLLMGIKDDIAGYLADGGPSKNPNLVEPATAKAFSTS
jgi:hypothetical protein